MPGRKPPRAAGGVAAELGVVDPRVAAREPARPPADIRERKRKKGQGRFRPAVDPQAPTPIFEDDDYLDPYEEALKLQPRKGRRGRGGTHVRVYHRSGRHGEERCWAFTITAAAFERLRSERILDHDGATYPTGQPVVPPGKNPLDYPVACGSCGTTSVECLQIMFEED